ncbi:MAG: PEGA domain-containing protein [Methanospirillum sp.]|uniref:PEGA domain-containing protein n=1 Tax=Methanospirillum sp. TaxID=45200 RepID=UPI00236C10A0|nr:PEGA domain-containing protein [Methanospirillum sp.]MDD1729270.1 PEGA domain-containing protein [Methanospirillum sp.]
MKIASLHVIAVSLTLFLLLCDIGSADDSYGDILIKSDQPSAQISLDGIVGNFTTPYQYSGVRTGQHSVTVTKPGYRNYIDSGVIVSPGKTTLVHAALLNESDYGTIWVHSYPFGAEVIVDGITRGKTPEGIEGSPGGFNLVVSGLQDGMHSVVIKREGYDVVTRNVTTGPEQAGPVVLNENLRSNKVLPTHVSTPVSTTVPVTVAAVQTPQPAVSGILVIDSIPAGAKVLMTGRMQGITPLTLNLPAGTYTLSLVYAGYTPVTATVDVKPGESTRKSVNLVRLQTIPPTPVPTTPPLTPVPAHTPESGSMQIIPVLLVSLGILGARCRKK